MTDTEFVRRVDRFQLRWRRPFSFSMVLFSVFYIGCSVYFFWLIDTGQFPLFLDEPARISFQLGVTLGIIGGQCIYFALFSLFLGLYFFFARRKDRLLVTYHRRLVELGELEDDREH